MISTKHNKLMALMAGSMLLYSCSNEEINTENADNRIMINISAPASRATVDNTWDEGNVIAVKYGDEVRQYTVSSGSTPLVPTEGAFEWAEKSQKIEAWFTGNEYKNTCPGEFTVTADQNANEGYKKSDFLHSPALLVNKSDNKNVTLGFYHQVAKLVVNIKKEGTDEIGTFTIGDKNIALTGTYTAPKEGYYGTWAVNKANQSASITPIAFTKAAEGYDASYAALIIPQAVEGTLFKVGELTYPLSSSKTFESGRKYTYNITITADSEIKVTLDENGEWNAGEPITYLGDTNDPTKVKRGDLILSDGSFIYRANAATMTQAQMDACRAVIFMVGQNNFDYADYSNTGIGQKKCNGYAVALHQAGPDNGGPCIWSSNNIALNLKTKHHNPKENRYLYHTEDFQGYKYTQEILKHVKRNNITMDSKVFGAVYYTTVDYEMRFPAPKNTTGWFLPSSGQIRDLILKYKNYKNQYDGGLFNGLPEGLVDKLLGPYWTSSEHVDNGKNIATTTIGEQNTDITKFIGVSKTVLSGNGQNNLRVRSILAF